MPEPGLGAFCQSRGVWGGAWVVYLNSLTEDCLVELPRCSKGLLARRGIWSLHSCKKHTQKVTIAVSENSDSYAQNLPMAAVILLF